MKESTGYVATVMVCGGTHNSSRLASPTCISLQADVAGASWVQLSDMPHGRLMPDSAILPDGTVLMSNGIGWGQAGGNAGDCEFGAAPLFSTDLYNPATDSWTTVGQSVVARMYHSGMILMDDATVITTGSEMANYLDFWGTPTAMGPLTEFANVNNSARPACFPTVETACTSPYEMRIEHYTPAYLLNNPKRPVITSLSTSTGKWTWNSTVGVSLDASGASPSRVTLLRYTTTTHSTNTDQRLLEPVVLFSNATYVVFRVPPSGNIAPPGNYHLFVLSTDGVPSVAKPVLLGAGSVTAVVVPTTSSGSNRGRAVGGAFVAFAMTFMMVLL
ncbi:hypothetical protein HDU83_000603 [Entophlyctis luteolus]|nr:hypothetical protein HDU83_000603 [Entophlyctis luteolus]